MEPSVTGEKGELWTYTEEWCCWSCYEGHMDGGATVGLSDAQDQLEGSDVPGWGLLEATFHIKCMQKMTVNISLMLMMLKFMSLTWSCCLNSKNVYPKGYPTWPLECLASISNGPHLGTFLAIQWLGLCSPNAGDMGLIPGWGTKILHASWLGQKKKKVAILIKCTISETLSLTVASQPAPSRLNCWKHYLSSWSDRNPGAIFSPSSSLLSHIYCVSLKAKAVKEVPPLCAEFLSICVEEDRACSVWRRHTSWPGRKW